MFAVTNQPATLKKLTTRTENHGPDKVPAASVELEVITNNKILDMFNKKLRSTFFSKGSDTSGQTSMDLEDLGDLTSIAMPEVKQLSWDAKYPGYSVAIGTGLEGSDAVILSQATLSNFRFEYLDGGSVIVTCTASGTPSGDQVADLYEWQAKVIDLTLTPPAIPDFVEPQADLLDGAEIAGPEFPGDDVQSQSDLDTPKTEDAVLTDFTTSHSNSTHLFTSTATLDDGRTIEHEWAHEPSVEDICDRLLIDNQINAEPSEELIARLEAEEA